MAKVKFKNLAHSTDESAASSVGGKRHTAIFDAWSAADGMTIAEIAEVAAEDCDVEVTDVHVSAYVRGVKETAPQLFKALPAIVKSASVRGRTAAQPVSESSLLAILKARANADDADDAT